MPDMVIETGKKPAQLVIDFDFEFLGRPNPLQISVWPKMGDKYRLTPEGWKFEFPRLKWEQEVFREGLQTYSMKTTERVPFDLDEYKRMMEQHGKAKDTKRDQPAEADGARPEV